MLAGTGVANIVPVIWSVGAAIQEWELVRPSPPPPRSVTVVFLTGPPIIGSLAVMIGLRQAMGVIVLCGIIVAVGPIFFALQSTSRSSNEEVVQPSLSLLISLSCKAILFDMDGTLVDSTACVEAIWARWAGKHGIDLHHLLQISHGRRT